MSQETKRPGQKAQCNQWSFLLNSNERLIGSSGETFVGCLLNLSLHDWAKISMKITYMGLKCATFWLKRIFTYSTDQATLYESGLKSSKSRFKTIEIG